MHRFAEWSRAYPDVISMKGVSVVECPISQTASMEWCFGTGEPRYDD
jgi:hypothetical protein